MDNAGAWQCEYSESLIDGYVPGIKPGGCDGKDVGKEALSTDTVNERTR